MEIHNPMVRQCIAGCDLVMGPDLISHLLRSVIVLLHRLLRLLLASADIETS